MKQLGSTKSMITKDENGEKVLHLEINEVVLVHFSPLVIIVINKIQASCMHLF